MICLILIFIAGFSSVLYHKEQDKSWATALKETIDSIAKFFESDDQPQVEYPAYIGFDEFGNIQPQRLEKMFEEGTTDQYPKKEVILMKRELEKLEKNLGGIKDMKKIPGALFIIDSKKEEIAIAEAHKLHIPVIATVDTNCDPDVVDFPIPANDDAIRAVRLLASKMADAVLEGRQGQQEAEAAKEAETEEAPAEEAAEQE